MLYFAPQVLLYYAFHADCIHSLEAAFMFLIYLLNCLCQCLMTLYRTVSHKNCTLLEIIFLDRNIHFRHPHERKVMDKSQTRKWYVRQ